MKLASLIATTGYRRGLPHRVAAAIEHRDAMRSLSIGTLVDVGANIGQFALLARTLHPHAVIHAFEPLAEMGDRFQAVFANDPLTTLHRTAAGEITGEAIIHVSARPACSSLLPISLRQEAIFPSTAARSTRRVKVGRIDDILTGASLPEPILVKLDVQGSELAVLNGMPRLLDRVAHVYAEVSFVELYEGQPLAAEVIAWLARHGLTVAGVHNLVTMENGATVQADMLFSRSPLPAAPPLSSVSAGRPPRDSDGG